MSDIKYINNITSVILQNNLEDNNEFIVSLFRKYPVKYHEFMLSFLLFIYNDHDLLQEILKINIRLLPIFKQKNNCFYPDYSRLLSPQNIKIIQKNILLKNSDFIYILHELSEENQLKILTKDKYIIKLLQFNCCSIFLKYLENKNFIINNIQNKNIFLILQNIFDNEKYYLNLNEKQKNVILWKIKKYIYKNPNCIIFVEKLLDTNSNIYKNFILECSQKNLKIWKFIDLTEEYLNKIASSKINFQNIINYIHFEISEQCLFENVLHYSNIIIKFNHFDEFIVKKIILKLSNATEKLKYVIRTFLFTAARRLLKNDSIIELLMSIDSCHYSQLYMDSFFYELSFELLCSILKNNPCSCILQLHTQEPNNMPEKNIYTLVELYGNILKEFDLDVMLQKYGKKFIHNCIKRNASTIRYFTDQDNLELDLKELVYENTFIVEFIDDEFTFKNFFIQCLWNISRNDSLFISQETYDRYFLDACNAYFLLHDKKMSCDIDRKIYSYLI